MKPWQEKITCKICGCEVSKCALSSHLKWSHSGMTYKEYYDKYIDPVEHKCPYCDKELKWLGYGGRNYGQTCGSKECHSKYVSEHNQGGTEESLTKVRQTKLERYGDPNYQNFDKIRQTCIERYGVDNVWKVKEIHKKCKDTLEDKTGKRCANLGNYAVSYEGMKFDSRAELLYYMWCKEQGKNIERCTDYFTYSVNGIEHIYYPDFKVDENIIEIKGEHLIDDEGYLLDFSTKQRLIEKTECLRKNNVIIIMSKDVMKHYLPSNFEDILNNCKTLR